METKKCSRCKQVKPTSDFNNSSRSADGKGYQCRKCHSAYNTTWYAKNRKRSLEIHRQYRNKFGNKLWLRQQFRIKQATRYVDGIGIMDVTLLGCTKEEFLNYIFSHPDYEDEMTKDNYGSGEGKWTIDHIIPLVEFDLSEESERKEAFHYTNTRPCWWIENATCGRKIRKPVVYKMQPEDYEEIERLINQGETNISIARQFAFDHTYISKLRAKIRRGEPMVTIYRKSR